MTDLAHRALEVRMMDAREAYLSALDAGQLDTADLAERMLDHLLDQYIHLHQQVDRRATDVPATPPTNY